MRCLFLLLGFMLSFSAAQATAPKDSTRPADRWQFQLYAGPIALNRYAQFRVPEQTQERYPTTMARYSPLSFFAGLQFRKEIFRNGGITLSSDYAVLYTVLERKTYELFPTRLENGQATLERRLTGDDRTSCIFFQWALMPGVYYRPLASVPRLGFELRAGSVYVEHVNFEGLFNEFKPRLMPAVDLAGRWQLSKRLSLTAGYRSYLGFTVQKNYTETFTSAEGSTRLGWSMLYAALQL